MLPPLITAPVLGTLCFLNESSSWYYSFSTDFWTVSSPVAPTSHCPSSLCPPHLLLVPPRPLKDNVEPREAVSLGRQRLHKFPLKQCLGGATSAPPHSRLPGAASPAPIAPFPWASPLPVPSHLHLRPSFQPSHSRCTFPGGPGGKEGEGGKGGDEGASGLSGILPDASGPPESARQRLPLSGLAWRARISIFQEPPTLVRESPQLQPLPHNAATAGEPVPSTCQQTRPRPAPHPRGAGSIPGLRGEGVRDRVASAPCRLSGDPEAAPVQTPVGPGRPCRWAGAEQRAGHRPRPARRGGDASGRLSPRRAPRDPSHSALGRPG